MNYSNDNQLKVYQNIKQFCSRSNDIYVLKNCEIIQVAKKQRWIDHSLIYKTDFIQIFEIVSENNFFILVPWSGKSQLPYEIFGIGNGNLPQSLAYIKNKWITDENIWNQDLYNAIKKISIKRKIVWEWKGDTMDFERDIEWGVQAIPLTENKFLLILHNAQRNQFVDLFINIKNALENILLKINFQGIMTSKFIFPCDTFIAIHKYNTQIKKKLSNNFFKNIDLISELDYEKVLDNLVNITKKKIPDDSEDFEISESFMENIFTENAELVQKMVNHKIFWQGKTDVDKITRQISEDVLNKLEMKLSGLDDKTSQQLGCTILTIYGIVIISPFILFFILPKTFGIGSRLILCAIILVILIFIANKIKNKVIRESKKKNIEK